VTRFVVDCETLLRIAAGEIEVAAEHKLVALGEEAVRMVESMCARCVFMCVVARDSPFAIGVRDGPFSCSYGAIVSRVICWPTMVKSHLRSAVPPGKLPVRRPVTR
jgi:hypothetical protein